MRGFFTALAFLTRLPVPRALLGDAQDLASVAPWLPAAGVLVGGLVAAAVALGSLADPWIGAILGLLAWVLVTGGLHLDGLSDVADGLGAAHGDKERFVAVARDPHLGSFGAMAIGLQIAAKLVLLAALAGTATGGALAGSLVLAAAWARWAALALGRAVPPLTDGLASRLAAGIKTRTVAITGTLLGAVTLYFAPVLIAALPLTALAALYWRTRLGGMTGDCHGATIEVMETLLLLLLAVSLP
ncbi:adenosylcobinamide-GDP ribazoletransferase [Hyphomicrobium sp.]|uniref:adenosylcobinamide-GDP ribazoletransferase n=1 Tax=Hyphomicrobium sp. TaxID=82 RepID=UPI002FDC867E